MKTALIYLLPLLFLLPGCLDDDVTGGFNVSVTQLAIYDFDVDIEVVLGEVPTTAFRRTDSTMILQITRTVDPDITVGGDDSSESIFIILPNNLTEINLSGPDWATIKTYAFTSDRAVNLPIATVTGGQLEGRRDPQDNSWTLIGQVEISETFGNAFPLELTGRYRAR